MQQPTNMMSVMTRCKSADTCGLSHCLCSTCTVRVRGCDLKVRRDCLQTQSHNVYLRVFVTLLKTCSHSQEVFLNSAPNQHLKPSASSAALRVKDLFGAAAT